MNDVAHISIKAVVTEYLKTANPDDEINRTKLKSDANTVASLFSNADIKSLSVLPLPVYNYGANLPDNFYELVQILYRKKTKCPCLREEVVEWVKPCFGSGGCKLRITKECPDCHSHEPCECGIPPIIIEADHNWNSLHGGQHFVGTHGYLGERIIGNSRKCHNEITDFRILQRTTHNFHTQKFDTNDSCNYPDTVCDDGYIIKERKIITNFKEGELLVAYLSNLIDEEGYLMIPDHPVVIRAAKYYLLAQEALSTYVRTRSQQDRMFWSDMQSLSEMEIQKAKSKLRMPSYDEFKVSLKNHWHKLTKNFWQHENLGRYRPDEYKPYTL